MNRSDFDTATDLFARHMRFPDVSVLDYLASLEAELALHVRGRCKVYLDTRYWVFLRDAHLGREKKPEHLELLQLLRSLVLQGRAICPVSDVAFMELTSQTDALTRRATAEIWDELSLGVALANAQSRIRMELQQFLQPTDQVSTASSLEGSVWTRPCFVIGTQVPTNDKLPTNVVQAVQKVAIDTMWKLDFKDLAKESSATLAMSSKFQKAAESINGEMREFQHEIPTFAKALISEVEGVLDADIDSLGQVILRNVAAAGDDVDDVTREQLENAVAQLRNAIVKEFRLKPNEMARKLPTIHILAASHAAMRMDKGRKFDGNFLRDIKHGAAGAAYHDAIFTERPLRVLLTAGNVGVDKTHQCAIISDERDALTYLEGIAAAS